MVQPIKGEIMKREKKMEVNVLLVLPFLFLVGFVELCIANNCLAFL